MNKKHGVKHYRLILGCLMLSTLSWFAVKMSKNYTQTYSFEVEFVNIPNGKVIVYQSDTTITVEVNGKGVSLISLGMKKKLLPIDYSIVTTTSQRKSAYTTIPAKGLKDYLVETLNFPKNTTLIEPKKVALELRNER